MNGERRQRSVASFLRVVGCYYYHYYYVLLVFLQLLPSTTAACLTTLNELSQTEVAVTDFSIHRTYTLCPNTRFIVGRYDYSYHLVEGQDPLVVRPNLTIKCGDDGKRSNQCLLLAGDVLVMDTAVSSSDNGPIVLQGLTLEDPGRHHVKLTHGYDVRFVDCEFRRASRSSVPLLLDFYQPNAANDVLQVYWHGCDFETNTFAGSANVAQPSLIVATNYQVSLKLHGCRFTSNDFVVDNTISDRNSFLIDTSGPLELVRNCFSLNAVQVSPVVSYYADANGLVLSENFAEVSRGMTCPFASHFRTAWQYKTDSPYCHDFDVTSCQAGAAPAYTVTDTPTRAPTRDARETSLPTLAPLATPKTGDPTVPIATRVPTKTPATVTPATSTLVSANPTRFAATEAPTRTSAIIPTPTSQVGSSSGAIVALCPLLCWTISASLTVFYV